MYRIIDHHCLSACGSCDRGHIGIDGRDISDSKATVETIKAFKVNRIVDTPAPQLGISVRKYCPSNVQKTSRARGVNAGKVTLQQ